MDFTVYPRTRIARLPRPLQWPALLLRNLLPKPRRRPYIFASDGVATTHFSPFLHDAEFDRLYEQILETEPWPGRGWGTPKLDIRWRVWILTQCARQCRLLAGHFAEFGVYRGGYAFMVLSRAPLRGDQRFYLFDTFAGIPRERLTRREEENGLGGLLAETSAAHVARLLQPWAGHVVIVEGNVFETLPRTDAGPIAFTSLDLNASAPTIAALEYVYPRLVPGAMIVMDDYGWLGYKDQRVAIDAFFKDKPESILALPTGQGLVIRNR